MAPGKFDVPFVTSHFGTCDLGHYLRLIREMSKEELDALDAEVTKHSKTVRPQIAFANTPDLTTHRALRNAIGHERLRRTMFHKPWLWLFTIRRYLVSSCCAVDLSYNEYFGAIYVKRDRQKTIFHASHGELLRYIGHFVKKHWFQLATLILAAAGLFITWNKQ